MMTSLNKTNYCKKKSNYIIIMSKLYYRLNSLCTILKQEQLIDEYDISHLKFEIDEKKLDNNYDLLLFKFEHDNKIFKVYQDYFKLLNDQLDQNFLDKYQSFIDEYEEEQIKITKELKKLKEKNIIKSVP